MLKEGKMPFITYQCHTCHKNVTEISNFKISGNIIRRLSCNHTNIDKIVTESKVDTVESITSIDGKKLYPFQVEGVKKCEESNLNFLFADEMGLGKTIQILAVLKLHRQDALPAAIICKSSLKAQWSMEIARWFGVRTLRYTVESARDLLPRGCEFYIFSYDILRRYNGKIQEVFTTLGIKTVVLDECQHIKNYNSQRSQHVREVCQQSKYKLAASGTPIKNNASEYFPILNILAPQRFRTHAGFVRDYCDYYLTRYGYKTAGLKDVDWFNSQTADLIIRRERSEVEIDFPDLNRSYQYYDLGENVEKAYQATLNEFEEYYENGSGTKLEKQANYLAYLNKMRHLTGLSKVDNAIDFVDDFLSSTDRKIVLFTEHLDVAALISQGITKSLQEREKLLGGEKINPPLRFTSDLTSDERLKMCEDFQFVKENRVMIAGARVAGEGINLQKSPKGSDCLMVERQWNPANEEQAEDRFIRIGSITNKVSATYLVALGTIDEFFAELVERKREIFNQVMNGVESNWNENELMKELMEELVRRNKKKWK